MAQTTLNVRMDDELKQQLQSIVGWTNEQPSDRTLMRCIDYLNLVLSKLK